MPIALTEVHLADEPAAAVAWWDEAVTAASGARAVGVDLRSVTSWSVFGARDWCSLLTRDRGAYEPGVLDMVGPTPVRTSLFEEVRATASGRGPTGAATLGWWRHPDRFLYRAPDPGRYDGGAVAWAGPGTTGAGRRAA